MNENGYALIACVLVITSIMLLAAVGMARNQLTIHESNTAMGSFIQAQALAEGCADAALLAISLDPTYTGDETIAIGSDTCVIQPRAVLSTTIETEAIKNGSVYRIRVELSSVIPVVVSSWERVSDF